MASTTLGARLRAAMTRANQTPASLSRAAGTTDATISNWINDNVQVDHVKAVQLFKIAAAVGMDAQELLLGEPAPRNANSSDELSHPVQSAVLRMAIQLVTEALDERGLALPPQKQAEAIQLAYDLLEEGLPQAKVLRFVFAAVA